MSPSSNQKPEQSVAQAAKVAGLAALADRHHEIAALYSWGSSAEATDATGYGVCLGALLIILGWRGDVRRLEEARPHLQPVETIDDMRSVLMRLGFRSTLHRGAVRRDYDSLFPYQFVNKNGNILLLCDRDEEGRILALDGETGSFSHIALDDQAGTMLFATLDLQETNEREISKFGWFSYVTRQFSSLILRTFGLSLLTNVSNLLVPLFVMVVYDNIIGTGSTVFLAYLAGGICLALMFDLYLRHMRGRALAYLGARIDALINVQVFRQLLSLPIQFTEGTAISAQLSKIKQFGSIREAFVGRLATSAFDMPFMLMFLVAIFFVGGNLVWIPSLLILAYAILAAITIPILNRLTVLAGDQAAAQQHFLIELVARHRALKEAQSESIWQERFGRLTRETIELQFRVRQFNRLIEVLAQGMSTLCGTATLIFGAVKVMHGDMTIGALIAVMAFVWRVLAPVQSAFINFNQLGRVRQSIRQLDNLMRIQPERSIVNQQTGMRSFLGEVIVERVSFRHSQMSELCLQNISLHVKPGELVAITGGSGSGKSTLLNLIAGLYSPQAGAIRIDGLDIRQLDTTELRNGLAIVPKTLQFFYGTVLQNIRLAAPGASRQSILMALKDAGFDQHMNELPDGLETRLTHDVVEQMPQGVLQRFNLARAYVKNSGIMLLDLPAQGLDANGDRALVEKLKSLKGKATVIMVTHRPEHMRLADRLICLEKGMIIAAGPPDKVLEALQKAA